MAGNMQIRTGTRNAGECDRKTAAYAITASARDVLRAQATRFAAFIMSALTAW